MDLQSIWGTVLFSAAVSTVKDLVVKAVKARADLSSADLSSANLRGADLYGANLRSANLRSADLSSANLSSANLRGADLYGANLRSANLRSADLSSANLYGAKNISDLANAESSILPEGNIVGWKKCRNGVIVKLLIPQKARRSNATGRKCRAEYAQVLRVYGANEGISQHDGKTMYQKGETVRCDEWNPDRWVECGGGIHFFLTRIEAENF
jgi:hypothetical protein